MPISLHEASTAISGRNFFAADQIGEQPQADAGPLDAHQFVEQGKPVEPHPAGRKEITALERRASAGALPRV